ncbi:MAG TPA: glutathione S-transferase family protein [Lysobacter sp.]|jgi:glutathione S-transferase|nr:glutathione S-transferase family protein [Lysobacter sp.]
MYSLYYAPGAASMVVHWLLIELGVPHELRLVDTKSGQQKSPEYLALNPNGVVPTLIDDGVPRFECGALTMMLADRHTQAGFAPTLDSPLRPQYLQWMFHLANAVQPLFRIWWYPWEVAGQDNNELTLQHVRPRIEAAWDRLDAHLGAHGPYLLGDHVSAVDFYLTMLMRWSRNLPQPATTWPHLAALVQRMKARPSFATLYEREGLTEWG